MSWTLFVFQRGFHHYLVAGESEENAWDTLSKRESISIKKCKEEYTIKGTMNNSGGIWKI